MKQELEQTLIFLSGDRFDIVQMNAKATGPSEYFDFGAESSSTPDSLLTFSGGLGSYAGALEELIERRHTVALISHFPSIKIAPVQCSLQKYMADKMGAGMLRDFPMRVQLCVGTNAEGARRARTFLFAALGMVTAVAFTKNRVSSYESGVISLNLQSVGNVLGTRATRTTHPPTRQRFQSLFSRIFSVAQS